MMVTTLLSAIITRQRVRHQTLRGFRLKDLSIDEWYSQDHRGLHVPVRFLLLEYLVARTVEFLSLFYLLFIS